MAPISLLRRATRVSSLVAVVVAGTGLAPESPTAPMPQGTWPGGYNERRQITINTGPVTPYNGYQGYTVRITGFDSATEIAQGDMRADGNDLRVFYWNGSTWVDVPRIVTGFNTADTHIMFQCQANIAANGSDTNHYIFYGNPGAGSPLAVTSSNVYLWWDEFSTDPFAAGRYTRAKAVDVHGDGYAAPAYNGASQRVQYNTGDNNTADMYVTDAAFSNTEQDVLLVVDHDGNQSYPANATDAIVVRVSAISTSSTHEYVHYSHGNYPNSPAIAWDSWTNGERNDDGGGLSGPNRVYWPFSSPSTWAFAVFGSTARFWEDGDIDTEPWFGAEAPLLSGATTAPQTGFMGVAPAQSGGWWDNFIIRRYTEPEPSLSFSAEESMLADMNISKSVNPMGVQLPGTDLTYTLTLSNLGNTGAVNVVVIDTLPLQVDFQVGSVMNNLPAGVEVTVEYSQDDGASWTYSPSSTACGAPVNYDRCVSNIRWSLLNDLSSLAPDNSGTVSFGARIR
jgi:uncharacterized repeat protein (TIGR01451 family)